MSNGPIPPHVDPRRFADRELVFSDSVSLSRFERAAAMLLHTSGNLDVTLAFGRDEQNLVVVDMQLAAGVCMECQRCLEGVDLEVSGTYRYAVVRPGADVSQIPREYDTLELGDESLDVLGLMEDELLLALPIVPMHEAGQCTPPGDKDQAEAAEPRSNPFSILSQLKRDSNV